MSSNRLIIDFSEEFIAVSSKGDTYITELAVEEFVNETPTAIVKLAAELADKGISGHGVVFSLPIKYVNHQIVTLPDDVDEKEQMVFLGLELNKKLIGKRFGIRRLDVTKRVEADQPLCDYLVIAPEQSLYTHLEELAKALHQEIYSVVPSFMVLGAERLNELRATAWLGEDRSEVIIWGKDSPLAMAQLPNEGDQVGDINRFIVEYFDHVDNLSLSMVYLHGPKMRDSALGFGLTYPHMLFEDATKYLQNRLDSAPDQMDISQEIKLPRPPIPLTPRNLTFLGSALALAVLILFTGFNQAKNHSLSKDLSELQGKDEKQRALVKQYKNKEIQEAELEAEKDFYLMVTKRRTPWQDILADISKLTPKEMWFERLNASKNKLLIMGKARTTADVSSLSINLNSHSKYVKDALIIGTRDYEEEGGHVYSEFQIAAKLKSPTGQFKEL